jgi:hypothetical protein
MFKTIIAAIGTFFSNLGGEVAKNVVQGAESVIPEAEAYLSALVSKWAPIAVAQVKAAATDPDLLSSSEKRSAVFTKLAQQLEADGHDIMSNGFDAFVNMMVEIGVNTVKLIEGTFLGAAATEAQAAPAAAAETDKAAS